MIAHTLVLDMSRDHELRLYLRRCLRESGLTQTQAGERIGRTQSWFPNNLFRAPTKTIRGLYVNEPAVFEKLVTTLEAERQTVLGLAGITSPTVNATEIELGQKVPVFPPAAGPALDDAQAVGFVDMPLNDNGGNYRIIGLRIHGDSMAPYLEAGDTAFIACEPALVSPGKPIGLYIPDHGSVVKTYVRTEEDGRLLLQSLNAPDGARFFNAPHDSRIYGPVINRLKKG